MDITWEFCRSKYVAILQLKGGSTPILEKISNILKQATWDGHLVVKRNSISKKRNTILVIREKHIDWDKSRPAIEKAILSTFPDMKFKEHSLVQQKKPS